MKKTFIVFMMVLLATMLMVSCDDSTKLPTNVKAGDEVKIGNVTWLVLKVDEGKVALLISKDILEKRAFDSNDSNDYTGSDIRTYLNGDFISEYGLSKDYIQKVEITKSSIETSSKNDEGEDYIFLLSQTEAENKDYFATDDARAANYEDEAIAWWLRTPKADSSNEVVTIEANGKSEGNQFHAKNDTLVGLRPAFWYHWD